MESVIRDVKSIESNERQVYESVLGHVLQDNQRIIIRVVDREDEADETSRRAALLEAAELARQGRAAAQAQGFSVEEADAIIDEAIREVRRSRH